MMLTYSFDFNEPQAWRTIKITGREHTKGRLILPAPFFFFRTALAIQDLLCFHMNCEIFCSSSAKNASDNLIGIILNL